jgi:LuxR family maltose regulon positive regulatory protein
MPRQRRESADANGLRIVIEPLTEKEREVLGHLAELLSTEEIAAAMFVSVNTVRTHVRSILRKLSASRRNEAVRRAREVGILDDSRPGEIPDRVTGR